MRRKMAIITYNKFFYLKSGLKILQVKQIGGICLTLILGQCLTLNKY